VAITHITGTLITSLDMQTNTERILCDNWVISTRQDTPKVASKPSAARKEAWNRFFLTALRKRQPCWHSYPRLFTCRTGRH
jgi:hypothetical protein